MWIARDLYNLLFLYTIKPTRVENLGIWEVPDSEHYIQIDENLFPNITWEDKDATPVTLKIINKDENTI